MPGSGSRTDGTDRAVGRSARLVADVVSAPPGQRTCRRAVPSAAAVDGVRSAIGRQNRRRGQGARRRRSGRVVCRGAVPVGRARFSLRTAAHAGGYSGVVGSARRRVPPRRRCAARRHPRHRRALRGGVRPADDRTGRRHGGAATAESALGAVGSHGSRDMAGDRFPRWPGPECSARARRRHSRPRSQQDAGRPAAVRARPRRLRGAEPSLVRPGGVCCARLGQPGVATGGGAAAHNARWEALHGQAPLSGEALRAQAPERLNLARA